MPPFNARREGMRSSTAASEDPRKNRSLLEALGLSTQSEWQNGLLPFVLKTGGYEDEEEMGG